MIFLSHHQAIVMHLPILLILTVYHFGKMLSTSALLFHLPVPGGMRISSGMCSKCTSISTLISTSITTTSLALVREDVTNNKPIPTATDTMSSACSLTSAFTSFGKRIRSSQSQKNRPSLIALLSSSTSNTFNDSSFELQELRAQLQTILKQNIPLQSLSSEKLQELSQYVFAIVDKIESPINFSGKNGAKNSMEIAKFVAGIENKSWRLVFATNYGGQSSIDNVSSLPTGSTVILRMGEFFGMQGKLDYVLKYGKRIMGLNELVAKSSCSVDIGPINPGLLSFQYEDIKSNIFGLKNLPIGLFGLLKGRMNYIDTVWFDGERWIERNYAENGDVIYSVYVRDIEDERR